MTSTSHTLTVPGASIHYELRGAGPLLAMIGAPMGSSGFAALAEAMASDFTVLTYDPRGSERSTVTDRTAATTPELLADDVHRVLAAVTDEPVAVLGSSGGAVTGLALVTAHPEQVSVLVAHEPPVLTLLSNAAEELATVEDIYQTYLRAGSDAAMRQFLLSIGVLGEEGSRQFAASPEPEPVPAPEIPQSDNDFFYANQIRATTAFRPDLAALQAAPTRIVVGVGATSAGQLAHRTGAALAEQLGQVATEFPGDHGGFAGETPAFAARLREVLRANV
ncbi:alpha/beta hydrolase [Microlunatus panaciterrae]|uniref:Pimeloyl-ACP methyl ester carboxylesterase n=1 Tax=Microlunatus panaciterrae TaxID=400768 RepID=A0ABS2RKC1_9ACTN|nr:alpha/beta hydrolase [Microlunatus panaciterrae]MBM7799113.1 pimeloyl-ACP methyl ester carboxylesterase [Microlunatus panaciterrae]